jgi:hypothetical protein
MVIGIDAKNKYSRNIGYLKAAYTRNMPGKIARDFTPNNGMKAALITVTKIK